MQDVGGPARKRGDGVHGRDLRHAFTVALLARRKARLELSCTLLRCTSSALAQVLVAHHDALAVGADDQQVIVRIPGRGSLLVERVEVLRSTDRELFDLALGDRRPGEVANGLDDLVEGRLGRRLCDQRRMPCENISLGRFSAASIG